MSANLQPLERAPTLDPSQDFYRLRREGIGHIQTVGADRWTDYNVHDPGVTLLESFCYAMTDFGYRAAWPIADLLAPATPPADPAQPYPHQSFFTAREILTVNPTTQDDFRRLLIDLPGVRDAWLIAKQCACDVSYWAYCGLDGALRLQYGAPAAPPNPPKEVFARGLYDVLLELDQDPEFGDLNDRLVTYETIDHDADGAHRLTMELRFPDLSLLAGQDWRRFLDGPAGPTDPAPFAIALTRLGATRDFDVFSLPAADRDAYLAAHWNTPFYATLRLTPTGGGASLDIENAALRAFGDNALRNAVSAERWRKLLTDAGSGGFVARYRRKALAADAAIAGARTALRARRNLDEDYCLIDHVGVEAVAVCADVEVAADADIEQVQGAIWFALETYMAPPIPFRSLREMRDAGTAVETIFNGPELDNGFIADGDLAQATLKSMLRGSDIINALMQIDGVLAVNQLRMTKYDDEGAVVAGAADPVFVGGAPVYDPARLSAAWLLAVSPRRQPRLYLNQSRFLFAKNGLPFLPRQDEALDSLNQLRGDAERPKNPGAANNLPIPAGTFRQPDAFVPTQYGLPLAYGVGPDGLPAQASALRRAQALDLKAFLMPFEQMLGDSLAQLAHSAELFSLDPAVAHTYFAQPFDNGKLKGFSDIADAAKLTPAAVAALSETAPQFEARRNRFLDHLLARFGEDFADYGLLLTASGAADAQRRLIDAKIAFLRRYPAISHDRARAFDYAVDPGAPGNGPGVKRRIALLLGNPDLAFVWTPQASGGGTFDVTYSLKDGVERVVLSGVVAETAAVAEQAIRAAWRELLDRMSAPDSWTIAAQGPAFALILTDASAQEIGRAPGVFATTADAAARRDELVSWSALERMIVVEHLLLRPKFIGDALYPACCEAGCATCGDEDPYSFRLTFVMPGWAPDYVDDLDLRRYADAAIQRETPSHLLPKICWVGNDGFVENPCDDIVGEVAALLIAQGKTAADATPTDDEACASANAAYHAFSAAFHDWIEARKFAFLQADALAEQVGALFQTAPKAGDIAGPVVLDAALFAKIRDLMTIRFAQIAAQGWVFERFEWAWRNWLDANAEIDWSRERLIERVEAILAAHVQPASTPPAQLCGCARDIVTAFGTAFFDWMAANIASGAAFGELSAFVPPAVTLCPGLAFSAGTQAAVAELLTGRYAAYAKPSYWLWAVTTLLAGLRNIYPAATLHDCDESGDQNPVRLGSTALGASPRARANPV